MNWTNHPADITRDHDFNLPHDTPEPGLSDYSRRLEELICDVDSDPCCRYREQLPDMLSSDHEEEDDELEKGAKRSLVHEVAEKSAWQQLRGESVHIHASPETPANI